MKECSRCKDTKDEECFYKCKRIKSGFRSWCKDCCKKYQEDNQDRIHSYGIQYNITNKDKRAEYRKNTVEQRREYAVKWREQNKYYILQYTAKHYEENKEWMNEYSRQWFKNNKDKVKEYTASRRSRKIEALGKFCSKDIDDLKLQQTGKCYYCLTTLVNYHVDHMTPLSRGGSNWPSNLCLTCQRCNLSKHTKTADEYFAWMYCSEPQYSIRYHMR